MCIYVIEPVGKAACWYVVLGFDTLGVPWQKMLWHYKHTVALQ